MAEIVVEDERPHSHRCCCLRCRHQRRKRRQEIAQVVGDENGVESERLGAARLLAPLAPRACAPEVDAESEGSLTVGHAPEICTWPIRCAPDMRGRGTI